MFNRKIFTIIASGAILALGTFSLANAATDSLATANANIITPLTITETTALDFGTIGPDGSAASQTVVLTPAGGVSTTGNAISLGGTAVGVFDVSGEAGQTYVINGPASVTISEGGGDTMTVGTFLFSSSNNGAGCTNATAAVCNGAPLTLPGAPPGIGTDTLSVGATLTLDSAPAQTAGSYSGAFPLEVIYN